MSYEMIVGLEVTDEPQYEKYRIAIGPILATYGVNFGFDCRVAEVLSAGSSKEINRLFVIDFPDTDTRDGFFSDPQYLKVKELFFNEAIGSTSILSSGEKMLQKGIGQ